MAIRNRILVLTFALLISTPGWSLAEDVVVVNGTEFHCQNECLVEVMSDGSWGVADSLGGWVHKHNIGNDSGGPKP